MTSPKIIRDPLADHMLTPQNAALLKSPRRLVVDRIAALNISTWRANDRRGHVDRGGEEVVD